MMQRTRNSAAFLCGLFFLVVEAQAAIEGVVINGTTGREQAGVEVTLLKLEQGMVPVGATRSDAAGKFRFVQSLTSSGGQPPPVMLRADFEGVTYNQMIPSGSRTGDVKVTVYRAVKAEGKGAAPEQHILLLEPSGREMIVSEFYAFRNQSQPPVTFVDARQGTLRFYLPAAAKGIVQASAAGPGGMPVRVTAEKSDQPDIHKVAFPIKPGESRVELTYLVPYQSPTELEVRTLYEGVATRVAAPPGVTLSGNGLKALPENPQIKASIFALPEAKSARLSIEGEGRLQREREQASEGGDRISIMPAPIHKQIWVILGFVFAILALGFYGLYTAGAHPQPQPAARSRSKQRA